MSSVLSIETKKIKWFPLLLAILLVPLLANVFGTINYLGNRQVLHHEWESLFTQVGLFYFSFFFVPLIGIIVGILWNTEHRAGLNFIRLSSITHSRFILCKNLLAFILISVAQTYFFLSFFLCGKLICHFGTLDLTIYLYYLLASILFSIPAICVFSALSIRMKTLGGVTILSVAISIMGFLTCAQTVIPHLEKIFALNNLAYDMNHFTQLSPSDFLITLLLAIVETTVAYGFSLKFLQYDE
ncbi:ABC transporter permease [Aedoeadaptatus coxii]|uniref:ABC transporter permease n=1 Tax=Aedoeadaptatus coxii TaxID=755172 RepID=UPI002AD58E77|nr:ABC transporter permease [Peptoniphilus coxii]